MVVWLLCVWYNIRRRRESVYEILDMNLTSLRPSLMGNKGSIDVGRVV